MTDDGNPESAAERARALLSEARTCTLATASPDAVPEAATVRFVADDDLNVAITTESMYRKYDTMTANPAVALVVDGPQGNLQLRGEATQIHDDAVARFRRAYVEKYGPSEYLTDDESVYFEITTHWVRLLADGAYPPTYEMVLGDGQTDPLGES